MFSREGIEDIPTARNMFGGSEEDMLGGIDDLPCDLPCAASLAGIQPVRPRAQRTSP